MNQIWQYLGINPKKKSLSDCSKTDDEKSTKPHKGSLSSYSDEANVFEEDVDSVDCQKVLFDCLKNLEQKKNNLNKEMQIKGDKKLTDITSLLKFLTSKFDEVEKERKEKYILIEVSSPKDRVGNLE